MNSASDHLALMSAALGEVKAAESAVARARARFEAAFEAAVQCGVEGLPISTAPVSEHRRNHRPGPLAKIDSDPELQAFVIARMDRLTFHQIAAEVAAHFPPQRRVAKSAIHAWWKKGAGPKARAKS